MRKRWTAFILAFVMLFTMLPMQTSAAKSETDVSAKSIFLHQSTVELNVGETVELRATVSPSDTTDTMIWGSQNEDIATVENGLITAVAAGETVVTVKAGQITAVCDVMVRDTVLSDIESDHSNSLYSVNGSDTNTESTTIYTGTSKPHATVGYVSSIAVEGFSVSEYIWLEDDAYVILSKKTADNAEGSITFTTGGKMPPVLDDTEVILSGGKAEKHFVASADWAGKWEFTIHMSNRGFAPVLAGSASSDSYAYTGEVYELDLSGLFSDIFDKPLTYFVKEGNQDYQLVTGSTYSIVPQKAGTMELTFKANNGMLDSEETYTMELTVADRTNNTVSVSVPEDILPTFYETDGFDRNGCDITGDILKSEKGESADGLTTYLVEVGNLAETFSVRGEDKEGICWGGMAASIPESNVVTMRKVKTSLVDLGGKTLEGTVSVSYGEQRAQAGDGGCYLLAVGEVYEYTSAVTDSDFVNTTKTLTLEKGDTLQEIVLKIELNHAKSITIPTGAKVQLYNKINYYSYYEYDAKVITDNEDGTSTYYYLANGSDMSWRVSLEGSITKAGYWGSDQTELNVVYSEADDTPQTRVDYLVSGQENSQVAEDSVLLNINGQNCFSMRVGETKTLKAYRAWELIQSYMNHVIMPDFTYKILNGSDIVSLSEETSPSNGDGDWMRLTALKDGTALIEVTYDAIEISGGDYDGVYGASDPARSGLFVVQVGEKVAEVDFGIMCLTSQSRPVDDNHIPYDSENPRDWDAEFDTLYFTGDKGELEFLPSSEAEITEVAVSNDKGSTWQRLTANEGVYKAKIVSGNNIIKVTTSAGTAYQVVRGDQITVTCKEVIGKSDSDGIVEAGETIRVALNGLHIPIPKLSGNYNPGFGANEDGYSSIHLNYTYNGEEIYGKGAQYNFITAANYVDIVIPDDEGTSVSLKDGYIGVGVIGLTEFAEGGDSHRNIPDEGCGTRDNKSTFHTRSILPDITITIGSEAAPNTAPFVPGDAVREATIELGQKFAINPETLFEDADGDILTFQVSVNGGKAESASVTYRFAPDVVGTYNLTFTASDTKESVAHTIILTVTEASQGQEELKFDLKESEIAGYVSIVFEDKGIRVKDESDLKYPVALGTIIEQTQVPFRAGENIAQVTLRLLDAMGIGYKYGGTIKKDFYLSAITNFVVDDIPYDEMGEFDAGAGSGWMITQNGWFIDKGSSEFQVKYGDVIKWQYTCQVGADIGDTGSQEAIDAVENLIRAIGTVTIESKEAIETARAAYRELNDFQQKQVKNVKDLEEAERKYAELVATLADKEAAAEVDILIRKIGTVTLSSQDAIEKARAAYDCLTEIQKYLVKKYDVLKTAELTLRKLQNADYEKVYQETGEYLENLTKDTAPTVGSIGGEWLVLGLVRSGRAVPNGYYANVAEYVIKNIDKNGRLHASKSTDNSRVILALTAAGIDPKNVEGYNLLAGLSDLKYVKKQGLNGPIWALIALDSGGYKIVTVAGGGTQVTREELIQTILRAQLPDGGWTLSGTAYDTDMTAMALQALSPYYESDKEVKSAIDRALLLLSEKQNADGSFSALQSNGSYLATCESTAQVIVALTALGINPEKDVRFVKEGISPVRALCGFAIAGGGFEHIENSGRDGMATEQGYYALAAYMRFLNNKTSLYDMSDVIIKVESSGNSSTANAMADKNAAAKVESRIDAIGTVTVNSGLKIAKARTAYNSLTPAQKKMVNNYEKLIDAENMFDYKHASYVEKLIDSISKITVSSEARIKKVRVAFDNLTGKQQKMVNNYEYLLYAEAALEEARVLYVEDLIDSIGNVTLNAKTKINRARTAYSNLSADNKKEVSNLGVLVTAEKAYEKLLAESKSPAKDTSTVSKEQSTTEKEPIASTEEEKKELTKIAEKVNEMLEGLNENSLIGEIQDAVLAYDALAEDEKVSIDKAELVETLRVQLSERNQKDDKTGICVSRCDWNIQLVVEDILDQKQIQTLQENLREAFLLGFWDIYLVDIITGERYEPTEMLQLKIPLNLLVEASVYDGFAVVCYGEDEIVEYRNSTVERNYIILDIVEPSRYAVVGYNGESPYEEIITEPVNGETENGDVSWNIWMIAGGSGILVLIVLLILLNRKNMKTTAAK